MVIGLILVLGFLLKKSKLPGDGRGPDEGHRHPAPRLQGEADGGQGGRQQLLVGVTPQQVNFLYRLEEPLDESQPQAFSEQLGKLMGKHEKR
jgi:flagellar protein FliO/FliZ